MNKKLRIKINKKIEEIKELLDPIDQQFKDESLPFFEETQFALADNISFLIYDLKELEEMIWKIKTKQYNPAKD